MAWLAVDQYGEWIFDRKPIRCKEKNEFEILSVYDSIIKLPQDSIKKLIGRDLTWEDEPVEI